MSLLPTTSLKKLTSLRGRERLIHVIWGVTRWLALALTLFATAAVIDWSYDMYRETPMWVRIPLMLIQLVAISVTALFWVIYPWTKAPSLVRLARRVETRIPAYDHRLVTSIQLTQSGARTEGMSEELIQMVTVEAEDISDKHDLLTLADTRRLKWSLALLAWPLGVLAFLLIMFQPAVLIVLLERQFLAHVDIPRDVALTPATKKNPWPAGDEVVVRYKATSKAGKLDKVMKGKLFYTSSENNHQGDCDLVWDDQTDFSPREATFKAKVPHSSTSFSYRARLGDGRSRSDEEVIFEPRPQITIDKVWVKSPAYIPNSPEVELGTKNINAYDGSRARLRITVQKPIYEAKLLLYQLDSKGIMVVADTRLMAIRAPEILTDGAREEQVYPAESDYFDLTLEQGATHLVGYSVAVKDLNRFDSVDNPRGMIVISHPKEPYVKLLPERPPNELAPRPEKIREEDVLEGMPVPLGGRFMVEYKFRSDIGVCKPFRRKADNQLIEPAWFHYRVNDGPWEHLPLSEVAESAATGLYDCDNATFTNRDYQLATLKNKVTFTAIDATVDKVATRDGKIIAGIVVSDTPDTLVLIAADGKQVAVAQDQILLRQRRTAIPRQEGGGFIEIRTDTLRKVIPETGEKMPLEINDRIGFYIAIHDCDPAAGRLPGNSDYREKTVKSLEDVQKQLEEMQKEKARIEEITKRQQEIYVKPKTQP